jgi:carbamoyl-phosphate synthase/aspartate carbamoyltransferase/dihydroorotase
MRQPGGEHKEDWATGSAAAIAGGITTVLAMPNTTPPVVDAESLDEALAAAARSSVCDYGHYLGATGSNATTVASLASRAVGLKMYLDHTFGELRLDDIADWMAHLDAWPADRPVVAHAEGRTAAAVILLASLAGRPVHICHVSTRSEIEMIARAKEAGHEITCEVAPHHLVLTAEDAPSIGAGRAEVRPPLATDDDRRALWEHLAYIDCFATDHAPHLLAEKDGSDPPPGFPGLETALPLLLTAVHDGLLSLADVVARMHTNPSKIFGIPADDSTYVEVDVDQTWQIGGATRSRAGWTPFEGRSVIGRVDSVVLRGQQVFSNGTITAPAGYGRDVRAEEP